MDKFELRENIILENDGQKIFGVIHRPLTKTKSPAVLICHGLAGNKTGHYRIYVNLAVALVKQGLTVLRIDYRGSGDSEGELIDMTFQSAISDAIVGAEFLKKDPSVDSSRVGFFGRSFGGAVAIKVAEWFGNPKSIVLWAPMFDGHQWLSLYTEVQNQRLSKDQIDELMRINGQLVGNNFWTEFFQVKLNDDMKRLSDVPLLHLHGDNDDIVNISHADHYAEARQGAKGLTQFIRLPNADHDFTATHDQKFAIEETTAWFKATL